MASSRVDPVTTENITSTNQSLKQTPTEKSKNQEHISIDIDDDNISMLEAENFESRQFESVPTHENLAYQSYKAEDTMPIIWLDPDANEDRANNILQTQLKEVTKSLKVVINDEDCEECIRQLPVGEQVILILAGSIGAVMIPRIHDSTELNVIYVYARQKEYYEKKFKKYAKVEEVITDPTTLIFKIREKQDIYRTPVEDELSVNVYNLKEARKNGNQSDANERFMWMHLFMDRLLHMSPSLTELMVDDEKQELTQRLKTIYKDNKAYIKKIDKFNKEYTPDKAIYWYTSESSLYLELNRALREGNLSMLMPFRFFIIDMYNQLLREHPHHHNQNTTSLTSSTFNVYRSQLLSSSAVLRMKNSINGYLSINSFLSTTSNREVARIFLEVTQEKSNKDLQSVLFEIEIDPSLKTLPYAEIQQFSMFPDEREVLFSPGIIFKILKIDNSSTDKSLCIMKLQLCDEGERELNGIVSYWKQNIESQTNLASFGWLMLKTGQLDEVEKFYQNLLKILDSNDPLIKDCYQVLGNVYLKKNEFERAIEYHLKAVGPSKRLDNDLKWLAKGYSCLADAYKSNKDLENARKYYEKALKNFKELYREAHQDTVTCLNNIGEIYQGESDYENALEYLKEALELNEKVHSNDPYNLIKTLKSLSHIHCQEDNVPDALKCLKRALKTCQKHFGANDPEVGLLHEEIGDVHLGSENFILALSSYHRAAENYYYSCTQQDNRNIEIQEIIKCCNAKLKQTNHKIKQCSDRVSSNVNQLTLPLSESSHSHPQIQPRTISRGDRDNKFEQIEINRHNESETVNAEYDISTNVTTTYERSSKTKKIDSTENYAGSNERSSYPKPR